MEELYAIIVVLGTVFGILQFILFFKIWGMTDDVQAMRNVICDNNRKAVSQKGTPDVQNSNQTPIKKDEKPLGLSTGYILMVVLVVFVIILIYLFCAFYEFA